MSMDLIKKPIILLKFYGVNKETPLNAEINLNKDQGSLILCLLNPFLSLLLIVTIR